MGDLGRWRFAAMGAIVLAAAQADAAEAPLIKVEFNDLQQADTGCRAVFVLNNGLGAALNEMTMRVVAFDREGRAKLFLTFDVGMLPPRKTRVLRFDLGPELACKDVGRLVLDDVTSCSGGNAAPEKCLAWLDLSSRAGVPFDY